MGSTTATRGERSASEGAQVDVRIVDCDVHAHPGLLVNEWAKGVMKDRLMREPRPLATFYMPPDGVVGGAMREDSVPPGGGAPGSDPEFAFQQLIREAGVDLALLQPFTLHYLDPELEHAHKSAANDYLAQVWLDEHNQYGRWYGSVSVSTKTPELSAVEIERWAGHPYMAEVLISPQMPFHLGDTRMDPIYAAAVRHRLPVVTHLFSSGPYEITPIYPVGMPAHWNDYFAGYPLVFASHLMSLIFDGTFDRHPELTFVFVEGAFTWAMPVIWRMDKIWEARKRDLPLVRRRPSEYVRDHIFFTTQPLETPEQGGDLKTYLEWMDPSDLLMFSSDYPHWTFDDPSWAAKRFPDDAHDRIMYLNAIELHSLPQTVPALPD
jgi:uncharacterized protein